MIITMIKATIAPLFPLFSYSYRDNIIGYVPVSCWFDNNHMITRSFAELIKTSFNIRDDVVERPWMGLPRLVCSFNNT